ncbi:VOC family protein [Dyadobacter sp. NIV53]|uniref:VOC family protein n=1 Tax=Dyadobacter sp. NIV53 TaxID=2861765 RepID=UPI001C869874|nr:VOC family protein [Dyadobacter sp. NIV53]
MELDHIFLFTHQAEKAANALQKYGLSEGTANVHAGQGTACRRFYFQNAYLELAWVIDEDEIKNPVIERTKLWERSQYELTKYCPFGICLRTKQQSSDSVDLIFEDGWRYYSIYLPDGQFANIASNEDFTNEPMLFEMPFFGIAPKDYPVEKQQPLTHTMGFGEITKVTLTLPAPSKGLSSAMKKVCQDSSIHISWGELYSVNLEFDDGQHGQMHDFTSLIPLIIHW